MSSSDSISEDTTGESFQAAQHAKVDKVTAYLRLKLSMENISIKKPLAVVFEGENSVEVGRSPFLQDPVDLPFYFQKIQPIRIVLYGFEGKEGEEDELNRVGSVSTTLGRLVSLRMSVMPIDQPHNPGGNGVLKATVSFVSSPWKSKRVDFKFSASSLDRKDYAGVGRSDPYFLIFAEDTNELLYQSEYITSTLRPEWRTGRFDFHVYDPDNTFEQGAYRLNVVVMDEDFGKGKNDLIGSLNVTLSEIVVDAEFALQRQSKKGGVAGKLLVRSFSISDIPSIGHYLVMGCDLWLNIAFDFTRSNMDPSETRSLHYLDSDNVYMKVIDDVIPLLLQYDPDGEVDCFGFSGKLSPQAPTQYAFNLKGNGETCVGSEGVKDAYAETVKSITLSGPTKVVPVMQKVVSMFQGSRLNKSNQRYLVLVIVADGVPVELDQFKEVRAFHKLRNPLEVSLNWLFSANYAGNCRDV
mmetsp:Transcript_16073/g.66219  ORF Transcript_16073/g.66219 Transcript_16073/m.66219 type:complete len:467 (-) Transcript_16073:2487-3887(-)